MMRKIAQDMYRATRVFDVLTSSSEQPKIIDLCMAPGGFLVTAMRHDSRSQAVTFSLATNQGGHQILMPRSLGVTLNIVDIKMLAEDMGVTCIPQEHPDHANILPRELSPSQTFDLVICDGQVLRTHVRAKYRESREATRLTVM